MEDSLSYIFLVGLLILSAFFSGSETAFFSLTKIQIKKYEKSANASERRINKLLLNPRSLLVLILLGNTLVNVAASSTAALIALELGEKYFGSKGHAFTIAFEIMIMTFVLLIFGEITPKLLAYNSSEKFSKYTSLPLILLYYLLYPMIKILEFINIIFSNRSRYSVDKNNNITTEDLKNLLQSESTEHPLEDSEKEIIQSIFRFFSGTKACEIMTPRVDIVGIESTESYEDLKQFLLESGHSKLPVYEGSIDNTIGIIYAKDVILNPDKTSISSLIRNPYYVTENSQISDLLNMFRQKKIQISVVVDEYGGTSGLLTLEDILEELVGEILDEYDKEGPTISMISDDEFIINGMVSISELNQKFDLNIPEEDYDNLAEFLYDRFNRVPARYDSYIYEDRIEFVVTNIKSRRIHYVRVKKLKKS